jgi:2'-5' RNA ligase
MQPGDRLVCAFVLPRQVGERFKQWPLHVTIVPWFRNEVPSGTLARELQSGYEGARPFMVSVGKESRFGYRRQKTVNLLDSPELYRLEGQTRRVLHAHGSWVVDEADKTRSFRPHVTAQDGERVHEGDNFRIETLYIIEQKGEYKDVTAEIPLG